jgi:tRNA A-37 threonylcarbamoyl transferase component Bud32
LAYDLANHFEFSGLLMKHAPSSTIAGDRPTNVSLKGSSLLIGRLVVLFYIVIGLISYVTLIPALHSVVRNAPEMQAGFAELGMSPDVYAGFFVVVHIIYIATYVGIGLLIFVRRSDDLMAIFVAIFLIAFGAQELSPLPIVTDVERLPLPDVLKGTYTICLMTAWFLFYPFLALFPNGRFVPKWTIVATILTIIFSALWGAAPVTSPLSPPNWWPPLYIGAITLVFGSALYAQIYRFRHVSTPLQRQQTKWLVYGFAIVTLCTILQNVLLSLVPTFKGYSGDALLYSMFALLASMSFVLIPLSIAFAILRYRLWDIDYLINRSLIYGSLTALLIAVFSAILYGVSLVTQGQQSVIGVVIAAVACGALFQPARRALQHFVDSRFYGIRIDYQKNPPLSKLVANVSTSATGIIKTTHIGAYQGLQLIGRGGMAEVYKAQHPTLNRTVAIKILPSSLASDPQFQKRFLREAEIVSKLDHPNIVRVYDYGEEAGTYYMVMEHISGTDLSDYLRSNHQIPLARVRQIIKDVAGALDQAHQTGLVHRDIKPSNVMIEENRAILMDFGIAKILGAGTALTKTGVLGTLDYIAPEQIRDSADVDGRADIYALGIMVYQMLTGELPYKHSNIGALLIAHMTQPPPDACAVIPDLPRDVADAIVHAMAKDPSERFSTAGAFAAALA